MRNGARIKASPLMDGLINQFQRFYSESFLDELLFLATALSDKVHLVAIRAIFKVQHSGLANRSINVWALFLTIVALERL